MGKPCISSGFMQTCPHPLQQNCSEPEQWSSAWQASTQMPIWSGLGLGQNSGLPSAAGNFNITFMLIFCYSVPFGPFFGTFTIAIPKAGLNTGTNLTGFGLGTQTRFFLCCNIIIRHFHISIIHLVCPPKFCIRIVFIFFWDGCNTQEK